MGAQPKNESTDFRNILILSFGFMLLIGAWRTTAAIQQTLLKSVQLEDPSFNGDGYLSQGIINGVFSVTNFIAPAIIAFLGVRVTLVLGTCLYTVFIANFLYPNPWLLYVSSVCIGFGSANVWVAYGTYLTRCSTKETIGKYVGASWAIVSVGVLLGNSFVFFKFQGMNHIDHETRLVVTLTLTGVAMLGSTTLMFLEKRSSDKIRSLISKESSDQPEKVAKKSKVDIISLFIKPICLLANKNFLLLIPAAMYNGLGMGFSIAIYPTTVAFSEAFGGDVRKLVGIAGILTAVGSLTGGLLFGVVLSKFVKSKRTFMVKSACVAHCTAFLLMYLNISNAASQGPTMETSWINPPSILVATLCAFLLGLGDACISTQMSAAIGVIWPNDPSPALAMYRFFQAATCAGGFFLGTVTGFHNLLIFISAMTLVGTTTFHINEALIAQVEEELEPAIEEVTIVTNRKYSNGLVVLKADGDNEINRSLN